MGFRWEPHSSMCGCERCALQWESERPQQVYDKVSDPDYDDYGNMLGYDSIEDEYDDYEED